MLLTLQRCRSTLNRLNSRCHSLAFSELQKGAMVLAALAVVLLTPARATSGTNRDEQVGAGGGTESSASRNRVSGTIGIGAVGHSMGLDSRFGGGGGMSARLGYAFQIFRGLELGAEGAYWQGSTGGTALRLFLAGAFL